MHERNGRGLWPPLTWKLQGNETLQGGSRKTIKCNCLSADSFKLFVVSLRRSHEVQMKKIKNKKSSFHSFLRSQALMHLCEFTHEHQPEV